RMVRGYFKLSTNSAPLSWPVSPLAFLSSSSAVPSWFASYCPCLCSWWSLLVSRVRVRCRRTCAARSVLRSGHAVSNIQVRATDVAMKCSRAHKASAARGVDRDFSRSPGATTSGELCQLPPVDFLNMEAVGEISSPTDVAPINAHASHGKGFDMAPQV